MADKWDAAGKVGVNGTGGNVTLTAYAPPEEKHIPQRQWVVEGLALRGHLTVIAGSGGAGKSSLAITMALFTVLGRKFSRFNIPTRVKVAFLSAEEDADETARRFAAACQLIGIDRAILKGWLFRFDFNGAMPLLAQSDGNGIKPTCDLALMEQQVKDNGIALIILDPLVELWEGDENDNSQVKSVASYLRGLARSSNAATILVHHVRKGVVTPGDIDAVRGGSSLGNAVRTAFTLTSMTKEMAQTLGMSETQSVGKVRLDVAKGNYISRDADTDWFEFVPVKLSNGPKFLGGEGDGVGVLMPWRPPGILTGVSQAAFAEALATIDAGIVVDGIATGDRYTSDVRSDERWAGKVLMDALGWDMDKAKAALKQLIKDKVLIQYNHKGADRKVRQCLKCNVEKQH